MGSNYLIKCLFVCLILWVKFNLLHSYEAKVIWDLCTGCVKGLVRWNSSFPIWGLWLLRAAPVPWPAALVCAFAMLGWEWQLQSLQVVYKAWSWFGCPVSAICHFSCPSLAEYLSREKSSSYCTRDLKNIQKEDVFLIAPQVMLGNSGNSLKHPWSSGNRHKGRGILHSLTMERKRDI